MEATYPLCHKEPARSKQRPELVLYGIRELAEQHYDPLDQGESSLDIPRPMRVENTVSFLPVSCLSDDQTCNDLEMFAPIYEVRREWIFNVKYVEWIRDELIDIMLRKLLKM